MSIPSQVYQCLQYQGKELQYIDENDKVQTRVLDSVYKKRYTNIYIASFRYSNWLKRALLDFKEVPLTNVLLPHINSPEMGKKRASISTSQNNSRKEQGRQTRNTINYNGDIFKVIDLDHFKPGDEVVWTKYSSREDTCFGRVVVTAEREDVVGKIITVVLVSLERIPITKNGGVIPGKFAYLEGKKNTYIIPEGQLLSLDEWIAVMTKEEEARKELNNNYSDDDNDWTTVVSKRKKGKKKELRAEDKEHCENRKSWAEPSTSKTIPAQPSFDRRLKKPVEDRLPRPKTFHGSDLNNDRSEEKIFPESDHDWKLPLDKDKFFKMVKCTDGYGLGIQGNNDSCYMDTSLFAMFSFTNIFDKFIDTSDDDDTYQNSRGGQLKEILRNQVIFQMRQAQYFVPSRNIRKVRKTFGREISENYLSKYMDVEEFLSDLFKLLEMPPFFYYDNDEGDHIHQIALPFTWDEKDHKPYISLQTLLENSFETFQVKLEKAPEDVFIVKLPVSDGVLIPSDGVIPNLTLDLSKLTKAHSEIGFGATMTLHAVICLRNSHFVAWVRTDRSMNSPWVYMDSKPTVQIPYISILPDVDQTIVKALDDLQTDEMEETQNIRDFEPKCENYFLFRHAYVCIYIR